ncbi:MAG TPA: hypothetical protein VN903_23880, partial [Polyangia bacterium]|nr:hypothetical protein [Polyangia bacterium]
MYDGVTMPRTSGFVVGLVVATIFALSASAETTSGVVGSSVGVTSPTLRPETIRLVGRRYVADLTDGGRAELTLDPRMQQS